jgi:hypothetical protein
MLSGKPVKVTGVVVYNFANPENSGNIDVSVGETRPQTDEEKSQTTPEILKQKMLAEKFHVWLYVLIERLQKGETVPTLNETKFVKHGKANIQIQFSTKTPGVMEKLEALGFEVMSERDKNSIIGRIAVEKISSLAEIAELQYILPKLN